MSPFNWTSLPTEIKQSVAEALVLNDAKSLSRANKESYQVCLPFTFRHVFLHTVKALQQFLDHVPLAYCCYIRSLLLTTDDTAPPSPYSFSARSHAVATLLAASPCLQELTLNVYAPLDRSIIRPFTEMHNLESFAMRNMQDEQVSPLSERLVTSICLSIPNLRHLSLTRVSRSSMHAPDLYPSNNFDMVPLVEGDDDIPNHPLVGSELNLPNLLRIKSLKTLCLEESCLGDPAWANEIPEEECCRLESVTLGTYLPISEDTHQSHVLAILERIAHHSRDTLTALHSQATPIVVPTTAPSFVAPSAATTSSSLSKLRNLKTLELGKEVPLDSVLETMETFSQSPIESVVVGCWDDEVVERCQLLEDFLGKRHVGDGLRSRSSSMTSISSILSSSEEAEEDMKEVESPIEEDDRKSYFHNLTQLKVSVTSCSCSSPAPASPSTSPLLENLNSTASLMPSFTPSERLEQIQATQSLAKLAQRVGVQSRVVISHSLDDMHLVDAGQDWFGLAEVNRNGRGRSVSLDTGLRQMGFGW